MKQIDVREGALRQHRMIGLFSLIQCWIRNLDGVLLQREHLERLIGIERFKNIRIEWLQEDLSEFFSFQETYWHSGRKLGTLILCRKSLDNIPNGRMSDEDRINRIPNNDPLLEYLKYGQTTILKAIKKS